MRYQAKAKYLLLLSLSFFLAVAAAVDVSASTSCAQSLRTLARRSGSLEGALLQNGNLVPREFHSFTCGHTCVANALSAIEGRSTPEKMFRSILELPEFSGEAWNITDVVENYRYLARNSKATIARVSDDDDFWDVLFEEGMKPDELYIVAADSLVKSNNGFRLFEGHWMILLDVNIKTKQIVLFDPQKGLLPPRKVNIETTEIQYDFDSVEVRGAFPARTVYGDGDKNVFSEVIRIQKN